MEVQVIRTSMDTSCSGGYRVADGEILLVADAKTPDTILGAFEEIARMREDPDYR